MSTTQDLAPLYRRDLTRLRQQIEAFPNDETLWHTLPGVTNPAGNLVLHLSGNLREYIGRQLGNLPYQRKRDLEFSTRGLSKEDLLTRIAELYLTIPDIIEKLTPAQMETEYPEQVLGVPMTTQQFVIHLQGHLNWHLGQIDYIRRIVTGDGAIKLAGL
jgi:hypothetical protein